MVGRVRAAAKDFYQREQELPGAVVVNGAEVEDARTAVAELGLKVSVARNGGCLVPEVWLGWSRKQK